MSIVSEDFMMIDPGLIAPLDSNPRKRFDEDGLVELTESIREHGIIQPLVVRESAGLVSGGFDLVAGERRWRCAQRAGLEVVPCLVRELTDLQVAELQLIENIDRRQLTALEESAGVSHLVDLGMDKHELAGKLGRSDDWVQIRLDLQFLPEPAKQAMEEDRMGLGAAEELMRLSGSERDEAVQKLLELDMPLTRSAVAELLRNRYHEPRRRRVEWEKMAPELVRRYGDKAAQIADVETSPNYVQPWGAGVGHWVPTEDEVGGLSRHPAESVITWGELAEQHGVGSILVCAGEVCLENVVEVVDKRVIVDAERALREQGKPCTLGPRKQKQLEVVVDEQDNDESSEHPGDFEQLAVSCVARVMLARSQDEELIDMLSPVLLASEIPTNADHLLHD